MVDLTLNISNIEAEAYILNCLIAYKDAESLAIKDDIFLEIEDSDFTSEEYRRIFVACKNLFITEKPIDLVTITEINTKIDMITLSAITTCNFSNAFYKTYIAIVKKHSNTRKLITLADKMKLLAVDDPYMARDNILASLSLIGENVESELDHFGGTLDETAEYINELAIGKVVVDGIKTPYQKLNYYLGNFQNGEVIIVAARPSVGKSAFVSDIILNTALKEKKSVAFFNLEMSKRQIALRMYANVLNCSIYDFKDGKIKKSDIEQAKNKIKAGNLYVDTSIQTIERLMRACRVLKKRNGLDLVCLDYLQLMNSTQGFKSRREEIEYVSRQLKLLAMELNIPIIALSQMSRAIELDDRQPVLSDLRESGAIEQDATAVLFLHRLKGMEKEPQYRPDIDRFIMVKVAKNRNGAVGDFYFKFIADKMKFKQIEKDGSDVVFVPNSSKQVKLEELETEDNPFES